jgi:hypothetical protein
MNRKLSGLVVAALVALVSWPPPAHAQSLNGLWDATVVVNNVEIPFRLELVGTG